MRCPRCNGALYQERDHYGTYVACTVCGWVSGVRMELITMERPKAPTAATVEALDAPAEAAQAPSTQSLRVAAGKAKTKAKALAWLDAAPDQQERTRRYWVLVANRMLARAKYA